VQRGKHGDGTFTLQNSIDAALFANVKEITGDLVVTGQGLTVLSLPKLETIGGSLLITQARTLDSVSLGSLKSVKGDFILSACVSLKTASFPALTTARIVSIDIDPLLATLSTPALTGPLHALTVYATALTNLDAFSKVTALTRPETESSIALIVQSNPALVNVNGLSKVKGSVAGIIVDSNDLLANVDGLGGVVDVGATSSVLAITKNPVLTSVSCLR
jgi:hypothetical protein